MKHSAKMKHSHAGGREKILITIDCGLTHARVTYAYINSGEEAPNISLTKCPYQGGDYKIPTSMWYDSDKEVREYGASAHSTSVIQTAKEQKWKPVQYFGFSLCPPSGFPPSFPSYVSQDITPDRAYADFFRYLLEQTRICFCREHQQGKQIWQRVVKAEDIEFVVAYPDRWGVKEQEVLREAVVKAGVLKEGAKSNVHVVSERDAVQSFVVGLLRKPDLQPGDAVIVCNTDGFIVDTTVHIITPQFELKTEGFPAGGCFVNEAAEKVINHLSYVHHGLQVVPPTSLVEISVQDKQIAECAKKALSAISQAELIAPSLKAIILVGGFAEFHHLKQSLAKYLQNGIDVWENIDFASAVAFGAAQWYINRQRQAAEKLRLRAQNGRLQEELTWTKERLRQLERDREEEQKKLKKDLDDAQLLYADLRSAVQVHDSHQSKDLVAEFSSLNSSIDKVCGTITDCIVDPKTTETSLSAKGNLGTLAPEALVESGTTADIFVFTFLRIHVSQALYSALERFHPQTADPKMLLIKQCYESIRRTEPQQNAARWRSWTYHALEQRHSPTSQAKVNDVAAAWAKDFASRVTDNAIKPLLKIFSPDSKFDSKSQAPLMNLAMKAYLWSHKVNTCFFQHDFHPFLFPFGSNFNPQHMKRDGASKEKATKGQIIACVGMGLRSSVAKGANRDPEEVLQLQVPIVTAADI